LAWTSRSSKNSKNKPSAAERAALKRLTSVRAQREPFRELSRNIIGATLTEHLPSDGTIIEIGMGDGQLFERLPDGVLARTLHTEPSAAASRDFRRSHGAVKVVQAPAEKLPVSDGEAAAVLGLCVLDIVPDPASVVRELARVLRPGGRVIHWLDMSTLLSPVVATLQGSELLLMPNIFSDPAQSEWPEDLLLLPREQLALIVAILQSAGHPLATPLGQYLRVFSASPLAVGPAAAELGQLQDDSRLRDALRSAFRSAFELAPPELRAQLASFQARPVSSARSFEQRLRALFVQDAGFEVQESRIRRMWARIPQNQTAFAYMSSCVGEQRKLTAPPEALLCADADANGAIEGETTALIELGVFTFVASRI
jgi:SAM-dependent methyltransferase